MNLDHINISAPFDLLVEVRKFYCDVLGLVEGDRPAFSSRGFWLYSDGQAVLHLFESNSHYPYDKQGYLDHVAFNHAGLNSFIDHLEAHRIQFQSSYIASLNLTQVFLNDPSGVKLEINFPGEKFESSQGASD